MAVAEQLAALLEEHPSAMRELAGAMVRLVMQGAVARPASAPGE
jgi:hypothetical protein